jgi:hypothetical protein
MEESKHPSLRRYPRELRERAVRMVLEARDATERTEARRGSYRAIFSRRIPVSLSIRTLVRSVPTQSHGEHHARAGIQRRGGRPTGSRQALP